MKKIVKRIGCGIVILMAVLLVVAIVGLQIFLKSYLGTAINQQVKPVLEDKTQVKIELGDASVNIVGGSVSVRDVKVGNPKQFSEPTLFGLKKFVVDVDMGRLLNIKKLMAKKPDIKVDEITLKDAEINIIRNADGLVNLKVLADTMNAGKEAKPAEKKPEEKKPEEAKGEEAAPAKAAGPVELPPLWLNSLEISSIIRYVDHAILKDKPLDIALKMKVDVKNISTYDVGANGTISITGAMATDSDLCKTDLKGHVMPLVDPAKPTFDIAGSIGSIDLRFVRPYIQPLGVGCDALSLQVNIVCTNGVFDAKQSVITLAMTKVVLSGDLAKSLPPGVNYLAELTVPVPIEGPINAPKVNMAKAITKAILDNAKNNVGGMVKGVIGGLISGDKGKKDSKSGDGAKSLGGMFSGPSEEKKDDGHKEAPKDGAKAKPKPPISLPF